MENLNSAYGKDREERANDRNKCELNYLESLLYIQNDEIDEWFEICDRIRNKGDLLYDLQLAVQNLGLAVKERDRLLAEIEEVKGKLGIIEVTEW